MKITALEDKSVWIRVSPIHLALGIAICSLDEGAHVTLLGPTPRAHLRPLRAKYGLRLRLLPRPPTQGQVDSRSDGDGWGARPHAIIGSPDSPGDDVQLLSLISKITPEGALVLIARFLPATVAYDAASPLDNCLGDAIRACPPGVNVSAIYLAESSEGAVDQKPLSGVSGIPRLATFFAGNGASYIAVVDTSGTVHLTYA